jgi:hypothetical protein
MGWVLYHPSFIAAVKGGPCGIMEPFLHISVTWRTHGGYWVLTGQVSPFWGLLASLGTLLAHVDSLTSTVDLAW